jgi:diguanylate cyclase (GGDEF)-like protein
MAAPGGAVHAAWMEEHPMRATTAKRGRQTAFLAAGLVLTCGWWAAAAARAGAATATTAGAGTATRAGAAEARTAGAAAAARAGAGGPGSLDARYFQRDWRRADGLPGNSVYAIAQAADGYLWVGTENGLVRFDGQAFVAYGARPSGVFRSRLVGALAAARDGTLWIGTERGLLRMRGTAVALDGPPGGLAAEAAVSALAEDAGGDLWIGTRTGLLRRAAASGRITRVALGGTRVVQLLPCEAGEVWVGTESLGAWRYRAGILQQVTTDPGLARETVTGLVRDEDGSILVFTARGARRFRDGDVVTAAPGRAPDFAGVVAAGAGGGSLWLGTADRGVVQLAGGKSWFATPGHPLATALIFKVFVAADRTVWFGTAGDGLRQLVEKSSRTYTHADGLGSDTTTSVLVEPDGTVWVGTFAGLTRMARRFDDAAFVAGEISGTTVWTLLRDDQGTLWAGTSRGLARRVGGRWTFLPPWGAPATQVVDTLYEDRHGNLWIGTGGGLGMMPALDPARLVAVAGLEGPEITGIAEDVTGALWIGSRGAGLLRLRDGKLETLRSAAELPIVTAVHRGLAADMWVGTFGQGLLHWDAGRWRRFHEGNGLDDNTVRQVREDPLGVWICSGAGISRLARHAVAAVEAGRAASLAPFSYGPEDGVAEGVCFGGSHPGVARSADGHLWFATNHGLVEIRPERLAPPQPGLEPRLDRVTVDGRDLEIGGPRPLRVPGGSRRVDFRFSAPVFVAHRRTAIRYRLVGLDGDWIVDDRDGLARYGVLGAGSYRFEVALRNEQGGWSEGMRLAEIEVEPLLYQRPAFFAAAALALLGASFGVHRWAARHLRHRAAALETLVGQRTEQLQEANRQLETLAANDALTGLANRRALQESLDRELRRATRTGSEISLVMVDVDYFKRYNDSLGHLAGDECLQQLALALRSAASRPADVVARYGGEEFAVLLPETAAAAAAAIAESLRQLVQKLAIAHPASPVGRCVTISAGVTSLVPAPGTAPEDLVAAADEALYRAKQNGRNQVLVSGRAARQPAVAAGVGAGTGKRRIAAA